VALPFIDTDAIIRYLVGDDPIKQEKTAQLFDQIEQGTLEVDAPDTVIADAVFVLSSRQLYNLPRYEIADLLIPLVRLPGFHVEHRDVMLGALAQYGYGSPKLDFGDAFIVASMRQSGSRIVYSYDRDFDKIPGIERHEP
jgi:predicted nucleic acid-binding protein